MILTCPGCAARFVVDERAFGPTGRQVRCGACGNSWHQLPDSDEPPEESVPPAAERAFAPAPSKPATFEAPAAEPAAIAEAPREPEAWRGASSRDTAAPEAAVAAVVSAASTASRESAATADAEGQRSRRGVSRILVWFLFVFVIAAILLGGYRFRDEIVRFWPPAAKVYEAIGMGTTSGYGLRVPQDSLRFRREAEGGVPILVVSGEIANESKKAQRVTPMRIALLDKENRVLRTERVKIDDRVLDPGSKIPFQTSIPNYPSATTAVRISFDVSE